MEFEYKCISKNNLTVVTFKGRFNKEALEGLGQCRQELTGSEAKFVIFLFKDVPVIDVVVNRELTLLQQELRKSKQLYLVGMNRTLKLSLLDKGLIRQSELKESLEEAIKSIEKSLDSSHSS